MSIEGKKILVTGADGFIGSHLCELLVSQGAKVRALSQYNSFNYWGWLEDLPCLKQIEVVSGDIRDEFFCQEIVNGMDYVLHLAALIAIPFSYKSPMSYVDTNIKGTLNMCQASLKAGVKKMIHTSTSEVYGTAKYVPINEEHPLQPQSPYSASKIAADAMAMSYYNSFNLPLVVARPFNTYGPRQSARAIIPSVITQIEAGAKKLMLGDLTPTRDFNYVEDTCRGFVSLLKSDEALGKVINIGSGTEYSVKETVAMIQKIMGSQVEIIEDEQRIRPEKSEVFRLCCDNTKIKTLCGYSPKYSLQEGLEKTVQWFKNKDNLKKYKTDIYNV